MASKVTGAPRGLEGVVAAQTRLSHVDGKNGVLIVAGYTIEELAGHVGFEAAVHLLWRGHLPDRAELSKLSAAMAELRELPALTLEVLRGAAAAPPIDALRAGTSVDAQLLGLQNKIGTLESGKLADVVVIPGDPIQNIRQAEKITFVMKEGVIYRNDGNR